MDLRLVSDYKPKGDQVRALEELTHGLYAGEKHQVLLGVTGSGKTYTMAKVIERLNRPAVVLAHNKTLAAQLYQEFKEFFPNNAVEYFVSYYDYYQPEAYIPRNDVYVEKTADVPKAVKKERSERLRALSREQALRRWQGKIGEPDTVLVDRPGLGYGDDYSPWLVDAPVGELVRVRGVAVAEEGILAV